MSAESNDQTSESTNLSVDNDPDFIRPSTPRMPFNLLLRVRWDGNRPHRVRPNPTYRIYEDGMNWAPSSKI